MRKYFKVSQETDKLCVWEFDNEDDENEQKKIVAEFFNADVEDIEIISRDEFFEEKDIYGENNIAYVINCVKCPNDDFDLNFDDFDDYDEEDDFDDENEDEDNLSFREYYEDR